MEDKVTSPEKAEEAKLKTKYPHLGQKPGGSDFSRKRLQNWQKYSDGQGLQPGGSKTEEQAASYCSSA